MIESTKNGKKNILTTNWMLLFCINVPINKCSNKVAHDCILVNIADICLWFLTSSDNFTEFSSTEIWDACLLESLCYLCTSCITFSLWGMVDSPCVSSTVAWLSYSSDYVWIWILEAVEVWFVEFVPSISIGSGCG